MYWLDFVLLLVLAGGAFLGARSGLVWQVARVLIFAAAVYACIQYHGGCADWLGRSLRGLSPSVCHLLAYVVTFLAVCLIGFLVTHMIERGVRAVSLKPVDRLLGALVGVVKAGVLSGAILLGVALYAVPEAEEPLGESKVAPVLLKGMRVLIVAVPHEYRDKLSETLDHLQHRPADKAEEKPKPRPKPTPDPLNDPLDLD